MNGAKLTVNRDVQGNVVLVTGADGRIGAALVAAFRKRGRASWNTTSSLRRSVRPASVRAPPPGCRTTA